MRKAWFVFVLWYTMFGIVSWSDPLALTEKYYYEQEKKMRDISRQVKALEQNNAENDVRLRALERWHYYANIKNRTLFQSFYNQGNKLNDSLVPADDSIGFPLYNGTSLTMLAHLGFNYEIADAWDALLVFEGVSRQGQQRVDDYWGLSSGYLSNPWTASRPLGWGDGSRPLATQLNLSQFIVTGPDLKLQLGSLESLTTSPALFAPGLMPLGFDGERLPLWGADVHYESSVFTSDRLALEAFLMRLPNFASLYYGELSPDLTGEFGLPLLGWGGVTQYETDDLELQIEIMQAKTDETEQLLDTTYSGGYVPALAQFEIAQDALATRGRYGGLPQSTTLFGGSLAYTWDEVFAEECSVTLGASYHGSENRIRFWDTGTPALFDTLGQPRKTLAEVQSSGSATDFWLHLDWASQASLKVHKVDVGASYDPFQRTYPALAGQQSLNFAMNYYNVVGYGGFLHDIERLPHNRVGWFLDGQLALSDSIDLEANFMSLRQKQLERPAEGTYFEPLFSFKSTNNAIGVGEINGWGVKLSGHTHKLNWSLWSQNYDYGQNSLVPIENIDYKNWWIGAEVGYDWNDYCTTTIGFDLNDNSGLEFADPALGDSIDHRQVTPYLQLSYALNDQASLDSKLRIFTSSGGLEGVPLTDTPATGSAVGPFLFTGYQWVTNFEFHF